MQSLPSQNRKGLRWTKEEEDLLKERYNSGMNVVDIGALHERTPNSIACKLVNLKIINFTVDARGYTFQPSSKKVEIDNISSIKSIKLSEKPKPKASKVKELQARIAELEAQNNELESKLYSRKKDKNDESELDSLREEVRNYDTSLPMTVLGKIEMLCEKKMPSNEDMKNIIGDDFISFTNEVDKVCNNGNWSKIYQKINENKVTVPELKEWLEKMDLYVSGEKVILAYLQKMIDNKTIVYKEKESSDEFKNKLEVITNKLLEVHNPKLATLNRGYHVYLLYNTGRVVSTKSGEDLFLNRSLFTVLPRIYYLNSSLFSFPSEYGNNFIIFEADDTKAEMLRNLMKSLYE